MTTPFAIGAEVADALHRQPVLALETSGLVGSLPYPANLEVATAVDDAARAGGAIPARIAVMDGAVKVGLSPEELDRLAADGSAIKAGTRDIGRLLAARATGAPTVSGSILAAHAVGIETFAVAGLGGVHRGAAASFDISTDLPQLARTPIAVMCAGVKSILDAGLTLEYLETAGVPVIGYGCDDFPGYLTVSSGRPNPARMDSIPDIARTATTHWLLGNSSAVVVTHPIDSEDGLDSAQLEAEVSSALADVERAGITGPDVTPQLLARLAHTSGGQTTAANRSVLLSTTRLGAELAVALHHERSETFMVGGRSR